MKKYADEDAALAQSREAAKAAVRIQPIQTNGTNHDTPRKPRFAPISCTPTLPDSAVVTPSAKGPRLEGQRNLQDSTFSISGKKIFFLSF